jgi:hypothetical protein
MRDSYLLHIHHNSVNFTAGVSGVFEVPRGVVVRTGCLRSGEIRVRKSHQSIPIVHANIHLHRAGEYTGRIGTAERPDVGSECT